MWLQLCLIFYIGNKFLLVILEGDSVLWRFVCYVVAAWPNIPYRKWGFSCLFVHDGIIYVPRVHTFLENTWYFSVFAMTYTFFLWIHFQCITYRIGVFFQVYNTIFWDTYMMSKFKPMRLNIEKYNGTGRINFALWQVQV